MLKKYHDLYIKRDCRDHQDVNNGQLSMLTKRGVPDMSFMVTSLSVFGQLELFLVIFI